MATKQHTATYKQAQKDKGLVRIEGWFLPAQVATIEKMKRIAKIKA